MNEDTVSRKTEGSFEERVKEAIRNPQNRGEMPDAHAIGTAGSAGCGDLLRVWIRFREEQGRRIIDKASYQSFGCETAIAVASLATEMIKGKTAEEAMSLKGGDFAAHLGSLPPMKVHCGALVEEAIRGALSAGAPAAPLPEGETTNKESLPSLSDSFQTGSRPKSNRRIVLLDPDKK